jgi:hypothetical protein
MLIAVVQVKVCGGVGHHLTWGCLLIAGAAMRLEMTFSTSEVIQTLSIAALCSTSRGGVGLGLAPGVSIDA